MRISVLEQLNTSIIGREEGRGGQLSNVLYSQLKLWSPNVEFDMNSPELLPVFDEGDVKLLSLDD